MNAHKALIEKLSRELEAMGGLISSAYTLESPEVQDVPVLSLHLNVGETRLIRDVLQRDDQQCSELRC